MEAVEILLLGVVGLSVLVFLILDNLDSKKSGDVCYSDSKTGIEDSSGYDQSEIYERECEEGKSEDEFIDDWEGVERSELEKMFGEAMVLANSKSKSDGGDGIGEDVKLQLDRLQKVALEGSQPSIITLHLSSRWRCRWQRKVGNNNNMSRESAMEKYIGILSEAIPHWNLNLTSKDEDTLTNQDGAEPER